MKPQNKQPDGNDSTQSNVVAPEGASSSEHPQSQQSSGKGSDAGTTSTTRFWRKPIFKIAIGLLALAAIVVAALFFFFGNRLVSTVFDNGHGTTFNLLYYQGAEIKPSEEMTSIGDNMPLEEGGSNFLVAPERDGLRLTMQITPMEGETLFEREDLCAERVFAVDGNSEGTSGDVCGAIPAVEEGEPLFYFFEFEDNGERYLATLYEDYNREEYLTSEEGYQRLVEKLDLSKYNDDLEEILGSIEVEE